MEAVEAVEAIEAVEVWKITIEEFKVIQVVELSFILRFENNYFWVES